MSLSSTDLYEIRNIVEDVVEATVKPLQDEIAASRNDIKEIYDMLHVEARSPAPAKQTIP